MVSGGAGPFGCIRTGHHTGNRFLTVGDRGNAPAEFVLVSALLVSLVLGLLQVLFMGYVRHSLTAAASEGARQASLVDVSAGEALALTRELIGQSLSPDYGKDIVLRTSQTLGVPTSEIIITAPIPVLGVWSSGGTFEVTAHAPRELVP
jgi:hypothetical protein